MCCAAVQPVLQAPGPASHQPTDPPSPAAASSQRPPSAGVTAAASVAAMAAMMGSMASADPAAVQPAQPAEQQQPVPMAALRPMSAAGLGVEVRSCCCLPSLKTGLRAALRPMLAATCGTWGSHSLRQSAALIPAIGPDLMALPLA